MNKILRGIEEAVSIAKSETTEGRVTQVVVPDDIDVKAIRKNQSLSQEEFALKYGFPIGTLRHWEQQTRRPAGAARILLAIIDKEPDVVEKVLEVA